MNPQNKHNMPNHAPGQTPGPGFPQPNGLYDPAYEKDSCGVGFVAHIKGHKSHSIVEDAITMLKRMDHRGACGCEANTGDGAGILTALPHGFLLAAAERDAGITLPDAGLFGAGNVFLPRDEDQRRACKQKFERVVTEQGQVLLGWRQLPVDPDAADVGPTARGTEPYMEQVFIGGADGLHDDALERQLYLIRKRASRLIRGDETLSQAKYFYVCSLSTKVIIYKGQLTSGQVMPYYPDLQDERYTSHLAMVHSRFSTNTFPSWDRAQPNRFMSHNGEINTLKGNVNWIAAREGLMKSDLFGDDLEKLFPIAEPDCSDSGNFDNALELLLLAGRSLPEAVMMMIPEAWENHESMPMGKRAFYEYHSALMEPWDGPASVAFTDGKYIGATLDRNGLRPSRYYVTEDDRVIMASEVGVLEVDPASVRYKGRLQPGRMFLVDFEQGKIIADDQIKSEMASARPYGRWLQTQRIEFSDLHASATKELVKIGEDEILPLMQAFGYTLEHLHLLMLPMIRQGKEAMGSMGNDQALAVLSDKPRLPYDYFKQMFAQVTNPPIDPLREEIIMSLQTFIGPEGNLLQTAEIQCHRLQLSQPILTNKQLGALKKLDHRGWRSRVIDITYERPAEGNGTTGGRALTDALDRICSEATEAIADGYQLIILSDRKVGSGRLPVSSLLATGAVHHHLVRTHKRTQIGLVLESAETREVHHFCVLFGYGADAVNPYLAFESLNWLKQRDRSDLSISGEKIVRNYIKSINKGLLKVMSKMGISTLASYKGAQIFEAIGLGSEVIDRCFVGTASKLQGAGFEVLAEETQRRHHLGFPPRGNIRLDQLPNPGEYHWRAGGDRHAFSPEVIANVQIATRTNSSAAYDQYAAKCNDDARNRCTLRGLLQLKTDDESKAIPLDQVEPAAEVVKRFRTGAMSLGALSKEAHETLAVAMNRMGGMSNSGEGGEDVERFNLMPNGDSKRSAIKQVASGRFGVTSFYLANADLLQIKIAQGAKPGEGGQLPAHKVDDYIANIRHSTPGVGLISPPPHHDIYSIEDLAQLIFDLKNANPEVPISVKLVSEVGVGTIASGVSKAHADHILISGHDGGTGASPLTSIKHAGLPWELGLAETHQTLVLNDLRSRVRLETDGGLKTGRDLVIAACLGAEEYGYATVPLIAIGCIMMRKCHLNTCPVGVCTQDEALRKKFSGQPEHVINFFFMVAEEARRYMAQLGVKSIDDLIGRVDLLEPREAIEHWKADGLDLSPILAPARKPREDVGVRKLIEQDHSIANVLDVRLIEHATPALEHGEKVRVELPISNTDRAVGTMLSNRVSRKWGEAGLPDDTIDLNFHGSAGQSLGAWLARGVTIRLEGDANDYVGKGLSGGKLIIYPPRDATFESQDNVIIGNVALYGATSGEAFFCGVAAERFCVRNSGANAVIEGVGDHGCEYMTGGRVVILGSTGRNFAAGMSGGIAYVWDKMGEFLQNCNLGMVDLEGLDDEEDVPEVKRLIRMHMEATGSSVATRVLAEWDRVAPQFVKVMPVDYRRVLNQRKAKQQKAVSPGVRA
jgi:glutamate synthase domain-containing protein 2/glutamate synthase domain-containing protein 1/glutamate synthase domain-containing protein 3